MAFELANDIFEVNLDNLDESQAAAVKSKECDIVIRAGAGSGKTSTLITAIANYRYQYLNDRICAITYTRAARAEMENRLKSMGIRDVEVTTIHVWARNLLNYFANKYDFVINVLEEPQIKKILQEISTEYLKRSRIHSINIGVLYSYITGNKSMDVTDNYRRTLNALEERYIEYKNEQGLYDFTDYPRYLWDVMETYDEYVDNIDALFVDEFQDVDSTQFNIFQRVNARKKFYIGDPWQSIFIFRGADGEVFNKLGNFQVFKLKYNYRSYQEIVDYASTVYEKIQSRLEYSKDNYISQVLSSQYNHIDCPRGYGGNVYVATPQGSCYQFSYDNRYAVDIIPSLGKILSLNPMFLCRTNKQVKALQDFGFNNVSTIHQAKGLEYDNVVVVDTEISSSEDLNIAYVALTRARDNMFVINWPQLISYLEYRKRKRIF